MRRRRSSSTLFPYTTLFRSRMADRGRPAGGGVDQRRGAAAATRLSDPDRLRPRRAGSLFREPFDGDADDLRQDRKSTRLNSSHLGISYAVFCLKKKNNTTTH